VTLQPASKTAPRAFRYSAGVRLEGTTLACDPARAANELVFLSHAPVPGNSALKSLLKGHYGGQQVLLTQTTLQLLGKAARPLLSRTLVCDYGRPFSLGNLRLELIPSGYAPGAAGLLCRVGDRSLLYLGNLRLGEPAPGARETEIRRADAVCIDSTFVGGVANADSPIASETTPKAGRANLISGLEAFARQALERNETPLFLLDEEPGLVAELAADLGARGLPLRAHAGFASLSKLAAAAGLGMPELKQPASRGAQAEVWLWPARLHATARPRFRKLRKALVSGYASDADARRVVQAESHFFVSARPEFSELLSFVQATGASQVAVTGRAADRVASGLRAEGLEAYPLVQPEQIRLFEPGQST